MINNVRDPDSEPGVLATLRALVPAHRLTRDEAFRVAERQAERLLDLHGIDRGPVPDEVVSSLPRVRLVLRALHSASGVAFWKQDEWVIGINKTEPRPRQRFILMHEFKHIIDYGQTQHLYRCADDHRQAQQAELAADYFAGCLLMPKRLFLAAWLSGMQRLTDLARHFEVSEQAAGVRLWQLGLRDDPVDQVHPDLLPYLPQRADTWRLRLPRYGSHDAPPSEVACA